MTIPTFQMQESFGTGKSVHIRGVSSFQELKCTQMWYFGTARAIKVSLSQGVLLREVPLQLTTFSSRISQVTTRHTGQCNFGMSLIAAGHEPTCTCIFSYRDDALK